MNSIRKRFNRSAQSIKRNIVTSSKRTDPDYDLLLKTINDQIKSLRLMDNHISQWTKICTSQTRQLNVLAYDTKQVYGDPTIKKPRRKSVYNDQDTEETQDDMMLCQPRELKMAQIVEKIAQKQEQNMLNPFIEKCSFVQSEIKNYLKQVKVMSRSNILKVRHKRLLDYEMYEARWNSISAKPRNTTKEMALYDDAKSTYNDSKEAFEEADEEAKKEMRQVIMERYSQLHLTLAKLYSEAMADYYDSMASCAHSFREIRTVPAPDPLPHEIKSDFYGDSSVIGGYSPAVFSESSDNWSASQAKPDSSNDVRQVVVELPIDNINTVNHGGAPYPTDDSSAMNPYIPSLPPHPSPPTAQQIGTISDVPSEKKHRAKRRSISPPVRNSSNGLSNRPSTSSPVPQRSLSANITFRNPITPEHLGADWYYKEKKGSMVGPVSFSELRELKQSGKIKDKTMIKGEGISEWTCLQDDQELALYL